MPGAGEDPELEAPATPAAPGASSSGGDPDQDAPASCNAPTPTISPDWQTLAIRHGDNLPHWACERAVYHVAFRLADSMPDTIREAWIRERDSIVATAAQLGRALSGNEEKRLQYLYSEKIEKYLDTGHGECLLANPAIAGLTANALNYFDGARYDLHAWSVMPNHVHIIVAPREGWRLDRIVHSWKSYTANEANKALGRSGPFWQHEPYDHIIRSEKEHAFQVNYVWENPDKAKLKNWPWRWRKTAPRVAGASSSGPSPELEAPTTYSTIETAPQDLAPPPVTNDAPAPGRRVRQVNKGYAGSGVHHVLYLPTDWEKGKKYPVIVEYAGNQWETSPGTVEGSNLGYGISGGKRVIWVCLPFVDARNRTNATLWWGDVEATVGYCKKTVHRICAEYGGDPAAVFLAGFSRGAIAGTYIGLHDDAIAALWRGFICHSHYDGVRPWPYAGSDRESAAARLKRLGKRPQFISDENDVNATKRYLLEVCPGGNFTFQALPFTNHTDTWVLRDIPERAALRQWFSHVLNENRGKPGPRG